MLPPSPPPKKFLKDRTNSLPKLVTVHSTAMIPTATPKAIPSLAATAVMTVPKIFWMMTLQARNRAMMTEDKRHTFAKPGCGEDDMNWGSLRQRRRHMEKKGRRQPLKV